MRTPAQRAADIERSRKGGLARAEQLRLEREYKQRRLDERAERVAEQLKRESTSNEDEDHPFP